MNVTQFVSMLWSALVCVNNEVLFNDSLNSNVSNIDQCNVESKTELLNKTSQPILHTISTYFASV